MIGRMKTLFFGIVLILLIGIGGFFYRNVAERAGDPNAIACTADAKLCPDGSAVGRAGPSCEFAPCPPPNVELPQAELAFVMPLGYIASGSVVANPSLLAAFVKATSSALPQPTIEVRRYSIPEGSTADDVILANTRYQPADLEAEDFSRFATVLINGRTFRVTVIERFEALVESAYYLAREDDVLHFSVVEHGVTDWMEPGLVVSELPEHQALLSLLSTLQSP